MRNLFNDEIILKNNKLQNFQEESKDSAISMSKNGEIILRIHAKPNAKTTLFFILYIGTNQIELAIASPPHDGQANETLINAMMDILELHKNEITFHTGIRSRSKILRITSRRITLQEVQEKLKRHIIEKG
ncbi:Uncharacterized protein BM_BM6092 [Brugia malayi]|uniref:Bm6092, isoform a n=1 Tax=Brugia malayi TaxID=6279 RepID=A0A0K0JLN1_BRUMA|nr:Uncharacterized protein BM_BM6092 [Brugia malayi]CDQ01821.1 Bm6092, isoform a [Brugia malayi]VIO97017.1 Uncharacterized protein BM_BM6092 [Brugia malayi]